LLCSTTRSLAQSGVLDPTFNPTINAAPAVTPVVRAVAVASGSRIVIGGSFTNVNNKLWNCLAVLGYSEALDSSFSNHSSYIGPDSAVRAIAVNTNGEYIVSGVFNTPGRTQPFLARLSSTGLWDSTFAYGAANAPSGSVDAIAVGSDNSVLVGGAFTTPRSKLARYLDDGLPDTSFNTGTLFSNSVRAVAIQPGGKILAGSLNLIVRLNSDGSRDTNFDAGAGPNGDVYAIVLQADGKILVGGAFTEFNGQSAPYLVRLSSSGGVDSTFDTVGGPNDWVDKIIVLPDGRILLGGAFTQIGTDSRPHIARLTSSGALDPTFNPEAATDDSLLALARLGNGMLVAGGAFTTANGNPRQSLARFGGTDVKITSIQMRSNGVATLSLTGQGGLGYILEGSSDFQNWGIISTGIMVATITGLQDTQSVNFPIRFYRTHSR